MLRHKIICASAAMAVVLVSYLASVTRQNRDAGRQIADVNDSARTPASTESTQSVVKGGDPSPKTSSRAVGQDLLYSKARRYLRAGLRREAKETLQEAVQANPREARSKIELAMIYQKDDWNYSGAQRLLEDAYRIDPSAAGLIDKLLSTYEKTGDWPSAETLFDSGSKSPTLLYAKSISLLSQGKLQEAVEFLENSDPGEKSVEVEQMQALAYRDLNQPEEAISTFEKIVFSPQNSFKDRLASAYDLSELYIKVGNRDKAIAMLQKLGDEGADTQAIQQAIARVR